MPVLESIGVAALGWVGSSLVAKLLNEGFEILGINADKKLKELGVTVLPLLKSVIENAEGSAHRSEVEDWLQRLKDACEDAEDALDLLKRRANGVRSPFRAPKLLKWISPVLKGGQDMLSPQKIKLRRMLNKLEKIAGEAEKHRDFLGAQPNQTAVPDSRQSISIPPKVFGRDKDCDEIIWHLKMEPAVISEPGSSGIPVIAIVGRPGVGKTTLAQYVYNKLEKGVGCDEHFDLFIWVKASHNFSASEIMKDIIQQASIVSHYSSRMVLSYLRNLDTMAVGNLDSLQGLTLKMNKMLNGKKFLLVIDDVWCDREDHPINWNTLFTCLNNCRSPGSKILVTSQTKYAPIKIVANKIATLKYIHDLEELEENHFWNLFIHYALPNRPEMNSSLRTDIEKIRKTIAKKLSKDPTAAKIVGNKIYLKLVDPLDSQGDCHTFFRTIAEKDWSGDKTKALMPSYRHLPAHLQRCFLYCSLYPRGYVFKELKLVQLWMAQGFIKPDDRNKRMEDLGSEFLKELESSFYIQPHDSGYHFSGEYPHVSYTLHELLYNLAEKRSRNDCLRIEGNHLEAIPSTIRHLSIPADKLSDNNEEICKLKKLRTLIVTGGERDTSEENVATDIFNRLQKLRVLEVKNACSLTKRLDNTVSLRYLQPSGIDDIGKLTSLQCLESFLAKKEKENELKQLQNLNELRGCLCIDNLENVQSKESVIAANFKEKKHLSMLKLVWHCSKDNVNSSLDVVGILGGLLQLPPNLTSLHLVGYQGQLWPSWHESQTSNIQEFVLEQCEMLEKLPPMDQLYPSCTSLVLRQLSTLKALHTLPPRLQKFKIIGTPFLTFATNEDLQMSPAEKGSIIQVMRKSMQKGLLDQYRFSMYYDEEAMRNFIAAMNDSNNEASSAEHNMSVPADDMDIWERWLEMYERKMELIYNRQNEAKLLLPSTLTELTLVGCNITDHALSACLQTLTSLTYLSLLDVTTITCLPSEDVLDKLKALQSLILLWCCALTSLGGIKSLPCLTNLFLDECPCLDSETAFLPSSLKNLSFASCANVNVILANAYLPCLYHLTITRCHMLEMASLELGNFPSLRSLRIEYCPGLSFLVNVQELHSLEDLSLRNCLNLEKVMNFPSSLKHLRISKCPILESSINIDPCSRVLMLGGIPVEYIFGRALIREEE